ncbi:FEN-1 [Crangon crangon nudivirus]|uniref:FEN-1 n=1 Tax=Crangon crangon nudivirus TaxID=2880838 RepID=A0AAE8Y0N0_9VIRU|nr:FEN-1 [Crangon crangon nudivirus]UBZ25496.1 FEN-1 [Crangon crangon nudivirus]
MGIYNFKLIGKNCKYSPLQTLRKYTNNKPANVYIDGNYYLFSGRIASNLNEDGYTYDELKVAQTSFGVILSQITMVRTNYPYINQIYFLYDGRRPSLKAHTISQRNVRNGRRFDIRLAVNYLTQLLNTVPSITIRNLIIGEAEHEAITRRDVSRPTIILTDDSDAVHIAYTSQLDTFDDYIFICTKNLNMIYDVHAIQKSFKLPKIAFTTLMALNGSDFTNHLFTGSMTTGVLAMLALDNNHSKTARILINIIDGIGAKVKNRETKVRTFNKQYPSYIANSEFLSTNKLTIENIPPIQPIYHMLDIYELIKCYIGLVLLCTSDIQRIFWNHTTANTAMEDYNRKYTYAELKTLWWTVNYSTIGCYFDDYLSQDICFNLYNSPLNFYHDVLTQPLDDLADDNVRPIVRLPVFKKNLIYYIQIINKFANSYNL